MNRRSKPQSHDEDGQPTFSYNSANNCAKAFEQLSGICRGMLADGEISTKEAQFFRDWLKHYSLIDAGWALDAVTQRVRKIFEDGVVTDDEREELKAVMEEIVGSVDRPLIAQPQSTTLPLDTPPPNAINFKDMYFCITGKFALGTRRHVFELIEARDGIPTDSAPTQGTNYLVIGTFASRDWISTSYGRKIERAVELRQKKTGIQIIAEEHWKRFL